MSSESCPCGSQKPYAACCEPVIHGRAQAPTAADLMRSRYSAFVKHEIEYLMTSVAPKLRKDVARKEIEEWARGTTWSGLEIRATEKGGPEDDTGKVEFVAKFKDGEEEKNHHELATFIKVDGKWHFEDGRPPPAKPVRLEGPRIGRNDPCHCGSGKKFKKCHGVGAA